MTSDDAEALLTREKPSYDGAEPSGNSVHLLNLLRLHELTTDDSYRKRAEKAFAAFSKQLSESPASLSEMLLALEFRVGEPREIVIDGRATAYVCRQGSCKLPTASPNVFEKQLRQGE